MDIEHQEDNKNLLIKVGRLAQANYDLRDELDEKDKEIDRLTKDKENLLGVLLEKEGIIKCIDNSNTILTKESREYRQTNADLEHKLSHAERAYTGVCLQHAEVSGRLKTYEQTFGSDCVAVSAKSCKSLKLGRYFINQPSKFQPLHYLNGVDVLAYEEYPGTFRIYPLCGAIVSTQVPSVCLSQGWSSARTSRICNYE